MCASGIVGAPPCFKLSPSPTFPISRGKKKKQDKLKCAIAQLFHLSTSYFICLFFVIVLIAFESLRGIKPPVICE